MTFSTFKVPKIRRYVGGLHAVGWGEGPSNTFDPNKSH